MLIRLHALTCSFACERVDGAFLLISFLVFAQALQPSYKKLKSVKFAIEPSTKEDQNYEQLDPSSPAPTSDKEEESEYCILHQAFYYSRMYPIYSVLDVRGILFVTQPTSTSAANAKTRTVYALSDWSPLESNPDLMFRRQWRF